MSTGQQYAALLLMLQSLWIYNDGVGFMSCSNSYKIKLQSPLTVNALLYVNVKVGWSKC